MKSILERLVDNDVPKEKAEELVESAKKRLEAGESPLEVLDTYRESIRSDNILDVLPDEK